MLIAIFKPQDQTWEQCFSHAPTLPFPHYLLLSLSLRSDKTLLRSCVLLECMKLLIHFDEVLAMKTLKTFSRARLNPESKKQLEQKLDISITQDSRGYWVITSSSAEVESLAIREFNRATHSPPLYID